MNKFFYKNVELDQLLDSNKYFLIGAKGTGKTALAVYLSNNEYKKTNSTISYIRETEYVKFINLKKSHNLLLSDYTNVWKVLILLLIAKSVETGEGVISQIKNFTDFQMLDNAIDSFYKKAFSPEIITALDIVEHSESAVNVFGQSFGAGTSVSKTESTESPNFQINLLTLESYFKRGLKKIKLQHNHILFIDGIDIRPRNIDYEDYLECVKGLANAVWELNNDFLSAIKGNRSSDGRIRVVILLRPDIFSQTGLHNLNTKVRDNSVLLQWNTTYNTYINSPLFALANKMLEVQQSGDKPVSTWDYYFPFQIESPTRVENDASFVSFLRFSWSRPRDIVSMMCIIQEKIKQSPNHLSEVVQVDDFNDPQVRQNMSNYLLGEIKDYLAFYHSDDDYELFLKFFTYLDGKSQFSYDEYMVAYEQLADYIENNNIDVPILFESSSNFLQFLYDLDVICYMQEALDGEVFWHWSYRERSYANVTPKVIEGVTYRIHYGLRQALSVGKRCRKRTIKKKKA